MKVATAAEMRVIDRKAIDVLGIPGMVLMENAGLRVVELIESKLDSPRGLRVAVVCGKGNNGGDGFVIARHLANTGSRVRVFLTSASDEIKGDAATHYAAAAASGISMMDLNEPAARESFCQTLEDCDVVVDALLGTGITGEVHGLVRSVVEELSSRSYESRDQSPVVSVDIPSGVDSDTGAVCGCAVLADWTVTFALPKRGLLTYPGAEYCGEVWLGDIGIPSHLTRESSIPCNLTTQEIVQAWLPTRKPDAHKGSCGRVGICAGSAKYAGAAILASRAATRGGAGLVTVFLPRSINSAVKAASIESTTFPTPETADHTLARSAITEIVPALGRIDALAIGPGISRHAETLEVVKETLSRASCPIVLDADAVFAFAGKPDALRSYEAPRILTPHPGEMAELLGTSINEVQANRLATAQEAAQLTASIVVLKGARTIIASPAGETYINPTGNAGMASGGTGDVLTGVIVALLGQGLSPLQAAVVGVYLHGLSGDLVAQRKGEAGLIAGDLVEALPNAWRRAASGIGGERINARLRRLV